MQYREEIIKNLKLKESVLCIWQIKGKRNNQIPVRSRHIPKGQNLLVFNFGDRVYVESKSSNVATSVFIVPAVSGSMMIRQTGNINLTGVSFIADGLFRLLRRPVHYSEQLPTYLQESCATLYLELKKLHFSKQVELLEQFLLNHIDQTKKSTIFHAAHQAILSTKGSVKLAKLAGSLNVSERQIQRLFKNRMGITPKAFCKIVRVNNYLQHILEARGKVDWMDLVVTFNYHDQPHLINEVKSISQLSPEALIRYRDTLYHRFDLIP